MRRTEPCRKSKRIEQDSPEHARPEQGWPDANAPMRSDREQSPLGTKRRGVRPARKVVRRTIRSLPKAIAARKSSAVRGAAQSKAGRATHSCGTESTRRPAQKPPGCGMRRTDPCRKSKRIEQGSPEHARPEQGRSDANAPMRSADREQSPLGTKRRGKRPFGRHVERPVLFPAQLRRKSFKRPLARNIFVRRWFRPLRQCLCALF